MKAEGLLNEKIFREWNEGSVYCADKRITLSHCDYYGRLKFSELLVLLSDCATEDYNRRGLPYRVLEKAGVVFLVSKMSIKFFEDIKGDSVITLKTWENSIEGAKFNRFFDIFNESGKLIAQARTVWLAVNPNTRKIIRPSAYPFPEHIRPNSQEVECMACGKIKLPEDHMELGKREPVFSDIDVNGHVNNTRYIAFAEDCLPSEFTSQHVSDIRINFVNEARLGDTLHFTGGLDRETKRIAVVGKKDDGITSFECEFYLR